MLKKSLKTAELPLDVPPNLAEQLVQKLERMSPGVKTEYLIKNVLSKYVSDQTDPPLTRRIRAINKWLATERNNEATNERLLITPSEYNILPRVSFESFNSFAADLVRGVLGDTPPIDALIGSFSGGASTSRPRTCSSPSSKYLGKAHVTSRCLDYFNLIRDEMPGWLNAENDLDIQVVSGNVLFTVPKKTDIDRVCCKEPDLNMFIQKGIGNHIRDGLRRVGINLNDQSKNRKLARVGSIDNSLSTLDLSSASDSLSEGLAALFLPECWYTLLDAVRCQVTIIDGEEHRNQMFSSMGNGFTFELESLLFWALAKTTAYFKGIPGIISVYGDDIICPRGLTNDLIWILQYYGFEVNTEKSCIDGPFRESCGGHYHNGTDITPFFVKGPIRTIQDIIHVANQLREWSKFSDEMVVLNPETEEIWLWLKSFIPSQLWGGSDTSFKYQLVSYDESHSILRETSKSKSAGVGGYYHWLNATWDREFTHDGIQTSRISSVVPNKVRMRRLRLTAVPRLTHQFHFEIDGRPRLTGFSPEIR